MVALDAMLRHLAVAVSLLLSSCWSQQPLPCFDPPGSPPPYDELPLCGNGRVDPGEVCDDGNRIDGDGCSSFCSHYDALTSAATLAGATQACPNGHTVLGGAAYNTQFCNLGAIETSPDGAYVLLGDAGQLLRFDLFTDSTDSAISLLPASLVTPMRQICSMAILTADGSVMVHDCGSQRMYLISKDGGRAQPLADLPLTAPSGTQPLQSFPATTKAYYDRDARIAVVAGAPLASASAACISVLGVSVSGTALDTPFSRIVGGITPLADLPCTVYGVSEGPLFFSSFDVRDMQPYAVTREPCLVAAWAGQPCYVVYMERSAHLELLRAYIPEDGVNIRYYSTTANRFDNALGAPLVRSGLQGTLSYTLQGACLRVQSSLVTPSGRSPPSASLGNACRRVAKLGPRCALPLNNPFLTDVITSPVIAPSGLGVTHSHEELSAILGATCASMANLSAAGPLLYRSMLLSVYGNTTPVDFVELGGGSLDIVYITPTSVGLVSTKRILFQDPAQPGYVRATNLIYCPPLFFGDVRNGSCFACDNAAAPGYFDSVAWQIMCQAKLARTAQVSAPFESFTVVASSDVDAGALHGGMCLLADNKNGTCPPLSSVTQQPPQPFNAAADIAQAGLVAGSDDLFACLALSAGKNAGSAQYVSRVSALGGTLLRASMQRWVSNSSSPDAAAASACYQRSAYGPLAFLSCAVPKQLATTATSRRRRLLQQSSSDPTFVVEHQGVSLASSTPISWAGPLNRPSSPGGNNNATTTADGGNKGPSAAEFPLWAGVLIGVVCALVLSILAYLLLCPKARMPSGGRRPTKWRGDDDLLL